MKTIKLIFLFSIAIFFSNCSTIKLTESAPFTVTGATYHTWVGGQPGVSGTNLIIGIDNKSEITIKSIYFRNRKNNPRLESRKGKEYLVINMNTSRERISVRQTITYSGDGPPPRKKSPKIKTPTFPFKLKPNEAVIKYMVGKKTYYYKVSNIKKTETIFYP